MIIFQIYILMVVVAFFIVGFITKWGLKMERDFLPITLLPFLILQLFVFLKVVIGN